MRAILSAIFTSLDTAFYCNRERDPSKMRLVFGKHLRFREGRHEQVRYISDYIIYPNFNSTQWRREKRRVPKMREDVALIKLSVPIRITSQLRPICLRLPSASHFAEFDECFASGWGESRGTNWDGALKQVQLDITNDTNCINSDQAQFDANVMICGTADSGGQPCTGDSGGPLSCRLGDQWFLEGLASYVTSSGLKAICGIPGESTVFSRLSSRSRWIDDLLQELA